MSEPFLSEIKIVGFNFPPKGWALCNGQLLPINQNQALFSLLGTTYGGDGRVNFALPNLRNRVPIHMGSGFTLGQFGGENSHTVTVQEMPSHDHFMNGTSANGTTPVPTGGLPARSISNLYGPPVSLSTLHPSSVSNVGGSQPHNNMQPYLVLNFIIALQGIFPSPN